MSYSLEEVRALCDMLRLKGVKRFHGVLSDAPLELELGLSVDDVEDATKQSADPDLCRCGHPDYAHTNGLCVHGCEIEKCLKPDEKAA